MQEVSRLLVLALVGALTGCSFVAVKGPPGPVPEPARGDIDCTRSRLAPAADTVVGVLAGGVAAGMAVSALVVSQDPESESWESGFLWIFSLAASAVAVPSLWSATRGYQRTGQCRAWHGAHARWHAAGRDPQAGRKGQVCQPTPRGWACAAGLQCVAERCVVPGEQGSPCRPSGPADGAASAVCDPGLTCLDGRCVKFRRLR